MVLLGVRGKYGMQQKGWIGVTRRVGAMELRLLCFPQQHSVHGELLKPPLSAPSGTSLTLHPKHNPNVIQSHLEKHTQFWLPELPRDTETLEGSEKSQEKGDRVYATSHPQQEEALPSSTKSYFKSSPWKATLTMNQIFLNTGSNWQAELCSRSAHPLFRNI